MYDGRNRGGRRHLEPKDRVVGYNRGKWMPNEEKKLIVAVHQISLQMTKDDEKDAAGMAEGGAGVAIDDIPWSDVASLVKTRTSTQCRRKWAETLKRSADSRKEAAEEKSTDLTLLRNLNKVLAPDPLTLAPIDVISADDVDDSATTLTLSRLPELHAHQLPQPTTLHLQQPSQAHVAQFQTYHQPHTAFLQPHQPQHIDFVVTRPATTKHPHEELILLESVDDQTLSNLQFSISRRSNDSA